ncbi:hypothetical protein BO221_47755 [Archangium sp. Cb G35]|uniref:hypothetical protein n=1 Tax=Archangium sp. Cb G35 TaxID=1920190 RepID=UPI000936FE1F|nr:hypothetical protein [Archangium sp. Cb G35]OJT16809.1 hypothetical protein BO221_47755 [Archangium sp. Cb G35]
MLSNMPKSVFNGLAALTVAIPVVAWSTLAPVHNVRASVTTLWESIPGDWIEHTATASNATFSWQQGTLHGFGNMQMKTKTDTFEFKLVRLSATYADDLYGEWDVTRNGVPTCAGCKGHVWISSMASDSYFKGSVERPDGLSYSFTGPLTSRTGY